jgi:hypothetical protein
MVHAIREGQRVHHLRIDDDAVPLAKLRQILGQWREERLASPRPHSDFIKGAG